MPIYEYKCKECGEHFEKRQGVSDELLTTCEKCGGGLEKQWSLSGFQFKGAGWYVTDYAAKSAGKAASGEKNEKPTTGESTDKTSSASNPTSDSTPAPKESGPKK